MTSIRFGNDPSAETGMTGPEWQALIAQGESLLGQGCALERTGDVEGAVEVLMRALGLLAGHGHHPLGADVLYRTGVLRARLGQTDLAEELFEQSMETASWCDHRGGQAYAVNGLAAVAQRRGDIDGAETLYRRAGRLALEACEQRLIGMVEQNLGVLANIRGDLDSALVHYRSALASFETTDDTEAVCWVLNNMGMLETDLGRYAEADTTLLRGLKLAKSEKHRVMAGLLELNRAEALIGMGRWRPAQQAVKSVLKLAVERDDLLQHAEALKFRAIIEREQGKVERSAETLDKAGHLAERADDKLLRAEILRELGETLLRKGQAAQARLHFEYAIRQFMEVDAVLDAADLRVRLRSLSEAAA